MNIVEPILTKTAGATVATANATGQLFDAIGKKQTENYEGLVKPKTWKDYDKVINTIAKEVQSFVYKVGDWTVTFASNGAYICTLGAYKVILHVEKAAVWGVAALKTAVQVTFEAIRDMLGAVLSVSKTAYEAADGFVREAAGRLRATVIDKATKREVTPKVTSKAITVMA